MRPLDRHGAPHDVGDGLLVAAFLRLNGALVGLAAALRLRLQTIPLRRPSAPLIVAFLAPSRQIAPGHEFQRLGFRQAARMHDHVHDVAGLAAWPAEEKALGRRDDETVG